MLKIIFGLAMTSALVVFKREFSSEITKTLLYKLAHLIKKVLTLSSIGHLLDEIILPLRPESFRVCFLVQIRGFVI